MTADVKIFAKEVDEACKKQIQQVSSLKCFKDAKIRIMPDCHAGKGCVIGFTAANASAVIPNLVGVDIGCGLYCVKLSKRVGSLDKFDSAVRSLIPMSFNVRKHATYDVAKLNLRCHSDLKNVQSLNKSLGTLGGGNHFIELGVDDKGDQYLIIHTGSRNLGKQVCEFYQSLAEKECKADVCNELKHLTGDSANQYKKDMMSCQQFAAMNRRKIASDILEALNIAALDSFDTVHNYISFNGVIRKGAICASIGKKVLIPFNMKDGCAVAVGKGNSDWNNSAPHGAGRKLSRTEAKMTLSLDKFKQDMRHVYSSSVCASTLDECPDAYKSRESILSLINETVEVKQVLHPIYNAKAGE